MKTWITYLAALFMGLATTLLFGDSVYIMSILLTLSEIAVNIGFLLFIPLVLVGFSSGVSSLKKDNLGGKNLAGIIIWSCLTALVLPLCAGLLFTLYPVNFPVSSTAGYESFSDSLITSIFSSAGKELLTGNAFYTLATASSFVLPIILISWILGYALKPNADVIKPAYTVVNSFSEVMFRLSRAYSALSYIIVYISSAHIFTSLYQEKTIFVACMVRGDHEVNLAKVKNIVKAKSAEFAEHYEVQDTVGCAVGSLGPVNMPLKVYVDNALKYVSNIVVGANKEGYHIKNVNLERDAKIEGYFDIRNAMAGDTCPVCGAEYEETRGIEVGHIFKLGTKYSESMGAKALDKNGKNIPIVMGCYGIGIGRTAASAIEQNYDEAGIIWPKAIAPFEVVVVPVNTNDEEVVKKADEIYEKLLSLGVDVIIDDRNERAGVKFNDADLIGYPVRVSVGKKALADGNVEVLIRRTKEVILVNAAENTAEKIKEILDTKVL